MPVWRLQTEIASDTALPRDRLVITPHVDDSGVLTDPQGLCDDWAEAVDGLLGTGRREISVRAYDAQGTAPVYPQGEAILNVGLAPAHVGPREVALCLSYYSERNIPRQRGRLYIPFGAMNVMVSLLTVRPAVSVMDQIMGWGEALAALGGADVDWVVYSRTTDTAHPVTNYWCDNEWDTMRSRGLRSTTREMATTSEA